MDRLSFLRVIFNSFLGQNLKLLTLFVTVMILSLASTSTRALAWENFQSPNFQVTADTKEFAQQVAETAEKFRRELAIEWLGKEMPQWAKPCIVKAIAGNMGAGGETNFSFCNGEVYGWNMNVRGSRIRILDSVIPHEVTHTILACHFRCPLPRWADEGASTLIEHSSEKNRQLEILHESLASRRIPLKQLFDIKEYPAQMRDVLTLYAEGYSVVDYLVDHGGKRHFLAFLKEGMNNQWNQALNKYYKITSVEQLESTWQEWVLAGSPHQQTDKVLVNNNTELSPQKQAPGIVPKVIRAQNQDHNSDNSPAVSTLIAAQPLSTNTSNQPNSASEIDWSDIKLPDEPNRSLDLRARPSRDRLEHPVYTLRPAQTSQYEAGPTHYSLQAKQGRDLFTE